MISLLPLPRVIGFIAIAYAVLVAILVWISAASGLEFLDAVKIATMGGGVLQIVLLVLFSFGWRLVWKAFPVLNRLVFPDLGGEWRMDIHFERKNDTGTRTAMAIVKQDFSRIAMDVCSEGSDSVTLAVMPRKDDQSGVVTLYYVFRVTPHQKDGRVDGPYTGAAVLRVVDSDNVRGNYWTDVPTKGHYELSRAKNSKPARAARKLAGT